MHPSQVPDRATLRAAGLLYLVIIACGLWSELFVRVRLIDPADAAATAQALRLGESLFRAAIAADLVMALADVGLALLLFGIFRAAAPGLALAATAFRLVQTAVIGASLVALSGALIVATGPGDAADQARDMLTLTLVEMHGFGYDLGLAFFALTSVLLGLAILRTGLAPRPLGALLIAAGAVYATGTAIRVLAPGLSEPFAPAYLIAIIAESLFCLWLLLGRNPAARPT